MKIAAAYIGWTRGTGFISRAIQHFDKSYFNHVFYRFDFENGPSLVYESHDKIGVQIKPWNRLRLALLDGKIEDLHMEKLTLSHDDMVNLWESCTIHHGKGYDRRLIPLYMLYLKHSNRYRWLLGFNNSARMTCNEFVGQSGKRIIPWMHTYNLSWTPERLFTVMQGQPSLTWIEEQNLLE